MTKQLIAHAATTINAPAEKVWDALINPEMIKQYLFGTEAVSDWEVGSSITYRGVWEGKAYEDKGTVLEVVPHKLLVSTYWSNMSGESDMPEHYKKVTYELEEQNGATTVTVTQDNNATKETQEHSEKNWQMVLAGLKKLLEKS